MTARPLAALSLALAAGLALNSLLGPLAFEVIDYRYTESFRNQGIGLDAFVLAIAVPLLIVAAVFAARGHPGASVLAFGPAAMAAYMLPQYVLGAHYDTIEGNNEEFFLWHLALFILSLAVAILAWRAASLEDVPRWSVDARRWAGVLMLVVALFLLSRYLPAFIDVWRGRPPATYEEDPIAFWIIALLDLGIVAPASAATGIALLHGIEEARRPMLAIISWFALVGPAVAAMGFAGVANDDPNATLGGAIAFTVYAAVFATLAAYLLRPLFRGRPK